MQFFLWRHGGTELQQLQGHAVLQVNLRGLTAAEAAQEAQGGPCALPGRHPLQSGGAGAKARKAKDPSLLSRGHDLKETERREMLFQFGVRLTDLFSGKETFTL